MLHGDVLHPLNIDHIVDMSVPINGVGWNGE